MSTLDWMQADVSSITEDPNLGHWHPASRPDAETVAQTDADESAIDRHAPVIKEGTQERSHSPEDFGLEDAPDAAQSRVVAAHALKDVTESPQERLVQSGASSRAVSWAAQPTNTISFEPPDLSSDEDEERLDPAWGIKKRDSAQFFQTINRSTSFPSFDESDDIHDISREEPLPHSQAKDIMHQIELEEAPGQDHEETHSEMQLPEEVDQGWTPSAENVTEEIQSNQVEPPSATDTEARFDEGVPLISADSLQEYEDERPAHADEASREDPFSNEDVEHSFFDEIGDNTPHLQQPHSLDRKSTAEVLEKLDTHPDDPPDSPVRQQALGQRAEMPAVDQEPKAPSMLEVPSGDKQTEEAVDDPWATALDDDEFLIDDDDDLLPDSAPDSPSSFNALLKRGDAEPDEVLAHLHEEPPVQKTPPSAGRGQRPDFARNPSSNPYAPHQPSTADLAQLSPTTYGNVGLQRPVLAPMNSFQQQLQQISQPSQKAESFVDQKGAYKSPYDLPMEIAKPRKRQQVQQPLQAPKGVPPPPPRTSSMSSNQGLQSPFSPTFPPGQNTSMPPPASRPAPRSATVASPPKTSSATKSSFFEELPITSRPRPATGQGRYTPQQNPSFAPPQLLPQSPPAVHAQPSPPPPKDPYAQYQLRAPEKLDPYANVPLQPTAPPLNPVPNTTRYSPNPTATVGAIRPSPPPRYSPAPPPQAAPGRYASQPAVAGAGTPPPPRQYTPQPSSSFQAPPATLPFQPRTSSPLAYMGRSVSQQAEQPKTTLQTSSQYDSNTLPTRHAPQQRQGTPPSTEMAPLRRPQTQSPGKRGGVPTSLQAIVNNDYQRPASVPGPPPSNAGPPPQMAPPPRPSVRQRGMTGDFTFIAPTDGQERDELQRWKGAPIFRFAFGGLVVSSFPKHVPRYAVGTTVPMIKSSAGEVNTRTMPDIAPALEHTVSFPGPLRSKSKKKDVLAWLKARIAILEQENLYHNSQTILPDPQKRHDEKILLWKVVQCLVEHDGAIEGSSAVLKSVCTLLSPEIHGLDEATASQYGVSDANGIYRPTGSATRAEVVDPDAVESLRKQLLRGEREKAVWAAVDKRLWSHALLISSTLEATLWKQVVQEFVRQEVKVVGNNTESLAALYEIFAGNFDESIDELVPPSARAGLQMVSKVDSSGPTRNALDGLDRWRETLSLVLSNRTANDTQALAALGKLLLSYGRVEAAHICYLFARNPAQPALFAGVDDPYAGVVLLGADHRTQPTEFSRDEDSILLTEIYEFAVTVLNNNPSASMPHLQVYKLQRVSWMADNGQKAEAQAYCEAVAAFSKSTTKLSPYYNGVFFAELDELSKRLNQVPIKTSSSWKTTPSLEKVGNSLFSKLSNFVAGEDSDAESKGSGKDANYEFGPFANVTGTPSLSRTGSSSDLYGSYPSSVPVPTTAAGSRYAPNGLGASRSSTELNRGRPSIDSQRSPPSTGHSMIARPNPFEQSSLGQSSNSISQPNMYQSMSQSPPVNHYQATPPQTSYMPQASQESPQRSYMPQQQVSYIPTPPPESLQPSYIPTPPEEPELETPTAARPIYGGYAPPEQSEEPEISQTEAGNSYEPPTDSYSGYEPPSGYVPYEPEPDSPEQNKKSRNKSYMDDDGDDFPRASDNHAPATTTQDTSGGAEDDSAARRRANDAAADAAFRAAAEADAARAKEQTLKPKSSGWFTAPSISVPFFGGGKKDANSLDAASSKSTSKGADAKVHRVHLGESKMSIYYDDKLKKWVNPADPESSKPKAGPPPPPRGATPMGGPPPAGPPRGMTPSSTMPNLSNNAPGSGPPSRIATPATDNASGAGTPPPPMTGGVSNLVSGPPSRPSTGQSGGGNDLDDLIGPATGGGRRTVKGKKGAKGRYIDVMAK